MLNPASGRQTGAPQVLHPPRRCYNGSRPAETLQNRVCGLPRRAPA